MSENAVIKNEIILAKGEGEYQEVRHIILEGSNKAIGKALGDIAREAYGVLDLFPYADAIYAKAHMEYIRDNDPSLLERMKGVAQSYAVGENELAYNTSMLNYALGGKACSAVFFPPSHTVNGHPMISRNTEFYTATFSEFVGLEPVPGTTGLFSQNYVMELYPDDGYPSMVAGSLDLLSGLCDGMNTEGLSVSYLADNNVLTIATTDPTRPVGLMDQQLARLLLETCATVDEAKVTILKNKFFMLFDGSHLMVADASGRSFIAELSEKDFTIHFIDNDRAPQIMTNHSVWEYPDTTTFPEVPTDARYDSFNRYRVLDDYIRGHEGKFSREDMRYVLSLVYANTNDSSEGAAHDLPCRILWPILYDCHDRSFTMKFYLKDGEEEAITGGPEPIFSETMEFKLQS